MSRKLNLKKIVYL